MCAQRRLRSAWASAQSDQSLRYTLSWWLRTHAFFMRTAKTLIRQGGAQTDQSFRLKHMRFYWLSHEVAQSYRIEEIFGYKQITTDLCRQNFCPYFTIVQIMF